MTEQEFEPLNRRHQLIDQKFSTGLTTEEAAELKRLQQVTAEYLDEHFPLPFAKLEELEELERKLAGGQQPE